MRRHPNSIPLCSGPCTGGNNLNCQSNARLLQALDDQNRLLTDLLGAVNALTAALLCRRPNLSSP